jgi:hypothetical protein
MVVLSFIHAESSYFRVILNMCFMALGMALVMAPATESVMGSLPRAKAGVGSAVNDTTRQMGGALGVAVIGSLVASVYAAGIDDVAGQFGLTGPVLADARGSLGGALKSAGSMGSSGADFASAAKDAFVHGLSNGLRLGAMVVLVAAFVAYRFLPATAHDSVDAFAPVLGVDVAPVAGS